MDNIKHIVPCKNMSEFTTLNLVFDKPIINNGMVLCSFVGYMCYIVQDGIILVRRIWSMFFAWTY